MEKLLNRLRYIWLESDMSLSNMLFGLSLILWGAVAATMGQQDLHTFAGPLDNVVATWVWVLNYFVLGGLFISVSLLNNPPLLGLITGTYATFIWIWISAIRNYPVFTSSVALNSFVIIIGFLLIIRSRKK